MLSLYPKHWMAVGGRERPRHFGRTTTEGKGPEAFEPPPMRRPLISQHDPMRAATLVALRWAARLNRLGRFTPGFPQETGRGASSDDGCASRLIDGRQSAYAVAAP